MYVILVYDVREKRVGKVCKYLRRYLPHIQNSVFEGELTEAKLETMKAGLIKVIDELEDSILLWTMRNSKWTKRQVIGQEKRPVDVFL